MPLLLFPRSGTTGTPITPATIESEEVVVGPVSFSGSAIRPLSIESAEVVVGPVAPPPGELLRPIRPQSIESAEMVVGPWLDVPDDTAEDDAWAALLTLTVVDQPHALGGVTVTPTLNDKGSSQYRVPRADRPLIGTAGGIEIGGKRIFGGLVTGREDVQLDPANEAAELCSVTLTGWLDDWDRAVVLPDFGAQDVTRLGSPVQDTRFFDWTMNGLGTDLGRGEAELDLVPSVSADALYGLPGELFTLPDTWPDPTARWMWTSTPTKPAPAGYSYFRVPFYGSGKAQVWCCANDQAEVWVDGVLMLTCDQPGVAQRVSLTFSSDFHLITIRAYNKRGRAGVLASVIPVKDDGLYGEPMMNSRSNWKSLAYPTRAFRLTPGRVVRRLHLEAQRRGVTAVGDWKLDFGPTHDSAGRPWPSAPLIEVPVGVTYLDVLKQLAENLVDFAPSPSGRRLRMWAKDKGTGRDVPVPWVEGEDLESRVLTTGSS